MAERAFAPAQFPGEGRGPDRCEAAPVALDWAPAFAGALAMEIARG